MHTHENKNITKGGWGSTVKFISKSTLLLGNLLLCRACPVGRGILLLHSQHVVVSEPSTASTTPSPWRRRHFHWKCESSSTHTHTHSISARIYTYFHNKTNAHTHTHFRNRTWTGSSMWVVWVGGAPHGSVSLQGLWVGGWWGGISSSFELVREAGLIGPKAKAGRAKGSVQMAGIWLLCRSLWSW